MSICTILLFTELTVSVQNVKTTISSYTLDEMEGVFPEGVSFISLTVICRRDFISGLLEDVSGA